MKAVDVSMGGVVGFGKKIIGLQALKKEVARLRRAGRTIAFTNGCFDLLHLGHVAYLEQAKHGDRVLIVGLNSDTSVRRIKGPRRPIVPQKGRAAVMAALESVDFVVIFNEDTPERLIKALQPDILVKGADWKGRTIAGADAVISRGGRVELIKYVEHFSTTNIIKAILKSCAQS